jgi:hypothetical protein
VANGQFIASFEGAGAYAGIDVNNTDTGTSVLQLNRGTNRVLSIVAKADNDTINFRGGNAVASSIMTLSKSSGNVGVGTTSPQVKLQINGEVQVGNSSLACSAVREGAIRYNPS